MWPPVAANDTWVSTSLPNKEWVAMHGFFHPHRRQSSVSSVFRIKRSLTSAWTEITTKQQQQQTPCMATHSLFWPRQLKALTANTIRRGTLPTARLESCLHIFFPSRGSFTRSCHFHLLQSSSGTELWNGTMQSLHRTLCDRVQATFQLCLHHLHNTRCGWGVYSVKNRDSLLVRASDSWS